MYADMGHFGPRPIRLAWYGLVLPCLLLNYAGQTAIVIDGAAGANANPFFTLCPPALQPPLVALATVATIIASQSIISGHNNGDALVASADSAEQIPFLVYRAVQDLG